ncbi:hypothetical protein GGD65_005289 [Bradyrhizobium sp. CIR18]|uniref:hypothetical protein n=1 Tax=Bradyrhizobium sp. CIR18 TaxID=2663839 RepID=UPI001605F0BB|nr:hypothetical protein [Bradyrhizobium sp. CIR18]MBB4364231.1 hypothetical protein [Bradyrhizobium sp. CIR18]
MSERNANDRPSIFDAVKHRREIGQIEFSYFRRQAIARIPTICKSIKRFDNLKSGFSF